MNSKQRRVLNRKFPHTLVFKSIQMPAEVFNWCNDTFGEGNFIKKYVWWGDKLTIQFSKSEHRNWFLVRWGSEF